MNRDFKTIIEENFGAKLTAQQLWALTKFAKNVRLRCRNNSAFNNFMNATFPYATFRQVTKTRTNKYTGQPESYPGLEIAIKGEAVAAVSEDEE